MDISFFLARVMGITLSILYLGIMINFKQLQKSVRTLEEQPVILFISGFISLVLGVLVIEVHNVWIANWRVIITIFGWIMLVVGAIRVLIPQVAIKLGHSLLERNEKAAYLLIFIMFAFGIYLTVMGFSGL